MQLLSELRSPRIQQEARIFPHTSDRCRSEPATTSMEFWLDFVTALKTLLAFAYLFVFQIIRTTLTLLQRYVCWPLTGVTKQLAKAKAEHRAHVLDIVWRYKVEPFWAAELGDFLLRHQHFADLHLICRDSVTLYSIDHEKAVFVETSDDVIVWKNRHGCFLSEAQYSNAKRVVVVYRGAFDDLLSALENGGWFGSIETVISSLARL